MGEGGRVDPDMARFFMALGALGYVEPAAKLAEVEVTLAWQWVAGLERPSWTSRRSEAAAHLFAVATEALCHTRALLQPSKPVDQQGTSSVPASSIGLRELVMVAERFYAAALRLDKDVAADGERTWELDLDGWASAPSRDAGPAAPARRAGGGDE